MKKIIPFILGAMVIGFVACEPEEVIFSPAADAFIITKTVETDNQIDTTYGLFLHVFANKAMQTVSASPNNETDVSIDLEAYESYPYDFFYQTPDDEFSTTIPFIGDYTFNIIAQSGETETLSDKLLDDFIYPTDTVKCVWVSADEKTKVSWTKIEDADYIVVKMFKTDEEMVFSSAAKAGTTTEFSFGETTSSWVNGYQPVVGTDYIIELDAYMYEPGLSDLNLQAKSINFKTFTWGE